MVTDPEIVQFIWKIDPSSKIVHHWSALEQSLRDAFREFETILTVLKKLACSKSSAETVELSRVCCRGLFVCRHRHPICRKGNLG